jgi:hypothetical protein
MNVRAQGPIIAVPRRWNSCLGILTIGMAWVMGSPAGPARGEGTAPGIAPAPGTALGGQPATSRIIHRFDFFEPNYFDPIPPGWVRFPDGFAADPEFPRYADARFDPDAGHVAPPSFYLASRGRSVAYRYVGDATRVRRGDYAVTGWVRPDRLARGRATLSAYYLDWEGQYVPGTQRFGRLIGSDPADASTGRGTTGRRSVSACRPRRWAPILWALRVGWCRRRSGTRAAHRIATSGFVMCPGGPGSTISACAVCLAGC